MNINYYQIRADNIIVNGSLPNATYLWTTNAANGNSG